MNKAPPYAVTNANPSLGQILGNMRSSDLLQWGAFVAVSGPFGYVVGGPLRRYVVGYAMFTGFAAGAVFAVQNSYGRLNGNKAP